MNPSMSLIQNGEWYVFLWQQLDLVCFAGDDAILLVQALNIAGKNRRAIFQIQNIVRHAVKVLCDMGR